ncbi:MAG: ATP-dependent DNA helicase RecG [Longimicrobiales bacterium]
MAATKPPLGAPQLDFSVQFLKGVGPRRAESLAKLGVHTSRDLLYHVPRRYEDASTVTRISAIEPGRDATVIGEIVSKGVIPTRSGLRVFQVMLRDETGMIECAWPGQPFLDRTLHKGDVILVTGPVRFFQGRQLQPREFIVLGTRDEGAGATGKVLPLYPATEGLSQKILRSILDQNLDRLLPLLQLEDPLPRSITQDAALPTLMQAIALLHRPATLQEAERGRRRLAYDELFLLQLLWARVQERTASERMGVALKRTDRLIAPLYKSLPFTLTGAQKKAIAEIFADMTSSRKMNRLLQGDVGSGKTIVALFAMALAAENDMQSALMAPTEILAEQHARSLHTLGTAVGLNVVLLTGRLPAAQRRAALAAIADGSAHIVVGTHALIQESVTFHKLGIAVIDEQHRFGVRQRLALAAHGDAVDTLVMSATPIPRSLALTLYGDLELTVLDELPPGRQPVRTAVRPDGQREAVYKFIAEQIAEGRQAYIVYPLIAESENSDLRAATEEFESLQADTFADRRLALLHGQMPSEEKDAVMQRFAAGEIDILIATTVIEVGIDVANASVMVVEHAERFGLSQLHQLRGRVGRGASQSYCILLHDGLDTERLRVMTETHDGFVIAREDLRLRGMGDFFGSRQHGLPEFKHYDPTRDDDLLDHARPAAHEVIHDDPDLAKPEHAKLKATLDIRFADRAQLYEVG